MKIIIITIITIIFSFSLNAEEFNVSNYKYKESRVKAKAKKHNKNKRKCYLYINVDGLKDWKKKRNELNTQIRDTRSKCKKYIIYKIIKNVNTRNLSGARNNRGKNEINLGVIVEDNANVDIEIYTQIKNSTIKNISLSKQEANTGIIVKKDDEMIDMENRELTTTTNIINSRVGKENTINEVGLDAAQKFLESDGF